MLLEQDRSVPVLSLEWRRLDRCISENIESFGVDGSSDAVGWKFPGDS